MASIKPLKKKGPSNFTTSRKLRRKKGSRRRKSVRECPKNNGRSWRIVTQSMCSSAKQYSRTGTIR